MQGTGKTFSESWYRVAGLKVRLHATVAVRKQLFRGETWYVGTVDTITWDQTNAVLDSIFYSTDAGTTWNFVAAESTSLKLVKYAWTVPNTPTTNALASTSSAPPR